MKKDEKKKKPENKEKIDIPLKLNKKSIFWLGKKLNFTALSG